MINTTVLIALARRIEHEEPSAELCEAIGRALGWEQSITGNGMWWRSPDRKWGFLPDWLGSLDAAVSLIPEPFSKNWSMVWRNGGSCRVELCIPSHEIQSLARTQPAAICAAALRAKAEKV